MGLIPLVHRGLSPQKTAFEADVTKYTPHCPTQADHLTPKKIAEYVGVIHVGAQSIRSRPRELCEVVMSHNLCGAKRHYR